MERPVVGAIASPAFPGLYTWRLPHKPWDAAGEPPEGRIDMSVGDPRFCDGS